MTKKHQRNTKHTDGKCNFCSCKFAVGSTLHILMPEYDVHTNYIVVIISSLFEGTVGKSSNFPSVFFSFSDRFKAQSHPGLHIAYLHLLMMLNIERSSIIIPLNEFHLKTHKIATSVDAIKLSAIVD